MRLSEAGDILAGILGEENLCTHRMDKSGETRLCLYYRKAGRRAAAPVGGRDCRGYGCMGLTLLIRGGRGCEAAEARAFGIYAVLFDRAAEDTGYFMLAAHDAPLWLGADDRGVQEYSVDFDLYHCII